MTMRRQALRSREPLVTISFLALIIALFFTLPSMLARAQDGQPGGGKIADVQPGDFDGSAEAAPPPGHVAQAPDTSTLPTDVKPDVDTTVTPIVPAEDASQAPQSYPLLPLTVVPKPDASPAASLKAGDINQRLVVLALLLTILSAVTLVMWRYHRRDYASPRRTGRRI